MPPRPPLANTVKLECNWVGPNSVKAANIMYALMGTGWTPTVPNLIDVATNLYTAWNASATAFWGSISNLWQMNSIVAYDTGGTTENSGQYGFIKPGTGTGTNPLPPSVALVISWTIPAHYRGGHPRTYIPGMLENGLTTAGGNAWTSGLRNAVAAFGGAFLNSFLTSTAAGIAEQLGTISFRRNNAPLATPVFYPFTGGVVHGRIDSQRRRTGKELTYL